MKKTKWLTVLASFGFLLTTANAQTFITNGLVAYYPFNGTGSDVAGNNSMIMSNTVFGADRLGIANNALSFNGDVSRWCRSTNVVSASIINNFTMTIWIKPSGFIDTNNAINGGTGDITIAATHGDWVYGIGNAGVGLLAGTNGIIAYEHSSDYGRFISYMKPISKWTQVCITYSNKVPSLYIDGVLVATNTVNPSYNYHPSSGFSLSAIYGGLGRASWYNNNTSSWDMNYPYIGSMDEYRIYGRALPSNEVAALFAIESAPIINIQKAVYLTSSNLWTGSNYVVQASSDLINWTNQGSVFTATNSNWHSTNYWDVANWNELFFRLQLQ